MNATLSFDNFCDDIQNDNKSHLISHTNQSYIDRGIGQLSASPFGSYLVDFSLNTYSFVNEKLEFFSGCSAEMFKLRGLSYTRKIFHPDDWKTYNLYVFPCMLNFLDCEPKAKWDRFEFLLNYRLESSIDPSRKTYTSIVQKSRFLNMIRDGLPYLSSGTIDHSNIPSSSNLMHLRIIYDNREVFQQSFISIDTTVEDLTIAEKKVLKYRANGYSYEEISQMMGNAVGTVSNHLKNLKNKTNCFTQDEIKILAAQFGLFAG